MDIKLLPKGERVLVDANILIYHLGGMSAQCTEFLERVARSEITPYLTTVIVAEVLHRRMMAEAVSRSLISAGQPLKKLKANPAVIQSLAGYISDVEDLLKLPFQIIEVRIQDIQLSHGLRRKHGLFVNDSINLACAERLGIPALVTHDGDFNRVSTIKSWEPTDV